MIAFDSVTQKEQNPAANKKGRAKNPFHEKQTGYSCEDQGNPDAMKHFVQSGRVLMVVLRHVVRQAGHQAQLPNGQIPAIKLELYT